jgi:magnesium-transporting ATPase (P-type)
MENPYVVPKTQRRVFKTPLVVPFSVFMVVLIYFGYVLYFFNFQESGAVSFLKSISFEVFMLCQIGIVFTIFYNKKLLDSFFGEHPAINNRQALEQLKPIVRTNMYSSLFSMFFIGLGALTAIMSILNHGFVKGVLVAMLSIAASGLMKWYSTSEENIKQIECADPALEIELKKIFDCWLHKPFPNF